MSTCVTIVVPVFNAAPWIERCAVSLLNQEVDARLDIVFVDNNSSDISVRLIPPDPRIRVTSQPQQGAYAARNAGVALAHGDYLLFTDPDCVANRAWVAGHLRTLQRPDAAISLGRVIHGGDDRSLRLLSEYDHARQLVVFRERATNHYFGYTNNLGVTRAAWNHIGPFEHLQRGADTVFVHRAIRAWGDRAVRYAPEAIVRHLEVERLRVYFKKMHIYGRSSRGFKDAAEPGPLSWRIRRRAVALSLSKSESKSLDCVRLAALLATGVAAWQLGYRRSGPSRSAGAR